METELQPGLPMALGVVEPVVQMPAPPGRDAGATASRNTAHGSTAANASPEVALQFAREALHASRQATAALLDVIHTGSDVAAGPEAAAALADQLQSEARRVRSLALKLARLARGLHATAGGLRPTPARRRAVLAEHLQRYKETHQALLMRAEAMLAGGPALNARQLAAATDCGLGQWLEGASRAGWGGVPAAGLAQPHRDFHRALAALVFAHQQGQVEAARRLRAELEAHTAALAAALDALCTAVLLPNDPAGDAPGGWTEAEEAALAALRAPECAHAPLGLP